MKRISIATLEARVTYNNEVFEITIEACHNTVEDSYEAWFYFNNDKSSKHLMFSVPVLSSCPDHFLLFIEKYLPMYVPLIALELDEYKRFKALTTYICDYASLSPLEKKKLLFESGVFWDDYQYDSTREEDRFIYANEYYREWQGHKIHNMGRRNNG